MLDTLLTAFNELITALQSIFLALTNMLFALVKLPSLVSNGLAFMSIFTNVLPPFVASFFIIGAGLAVIQWGLPGKIGGK